jgi:hypothetical protein
LQVNELLKKEAIYKNIKEQGVIFDQIEYHLLQPERIETYLKSKETALSNNQGIDTFVLTKTDSLKLKIADDKILMSKYIKLKNKYKSLLNLKLTKEEKREIENYYNIKLAKIDSLYAIFREKAPYKLPKKNALNYKISPSHQSCLKSSKGEETCLRNLLYSEMKNKFSNPNLRSLNEELYVTTLIVIDKNGYLSPESIQQSSNHFEYDFETLLNFERTFDNTQFIPAMSKEKAIDFYLTIPFSYSN